MRYDLLRGERPDTLAYDTCIIGAGAAGITIARKLAAAGRRVALCEGGGLDFSTQSQDIYIGRVEGDPYFDLDACRLRYFGGTTNHWGGKVRSLDPVDFMRDLQFGPAYAWPITHADLAPHLAEACEIVEVPAEFDDEVLDAEIGVMLTRFHFSPPVYFADKYLAEIEASDRIDLFLNANFLDFEADGDAARAARAVVADFRGQELRLDADRFVLAMGGIENSRQLLWLRERHGGRFFDDTTPLGRYWMEHPHFVLGEALVGPEVESGRYFGLTPMAQGAAGILNCGLELDRQGETQTRRMIHDLLCIAPRVGARLLELADRSLICGVRIRAAWEQAPEAENRVALSDRARDAFGVPRPVLHWRKGALDRQTIVASLQVYNNWLMSADLGRLRVIGWLRREEDYPGDDLLGGNHHMGGTRMGTRRDLSVVDANCRLHGSDNIYVAGSSVFATSGHANPTLPLLQLSLRLAAHLVA